MKIDTSLVDTPYKDYNVKIDWRSTMNFAAAIEDDSPYYFDDEREGGIVAHPMHVVAVTWPIIQNLSEYILSTDFPIKAINKVVHYTEHIILNRLIRPGDELTIKGKIAAIFPHRAGTQLIQRFDAINEANEPVFTEYMGGLLRGIGCKGEPRGVGTIPEIPNWDTTQEKIWSQLVPIDKLRSFIYDGCTQIFFPIHTSKKFAHFVGLPDIILQGTATLAYAVKEIIHREAKGDPLKISHIACKFTGMVFPGTNIQINLIGKEERKDGYNLYFDVENNQNQKAIREGYVHLKK